MARVNKEKTADGTYSMAEAKKAHAEHNASNVKADDGTLKAEAPSDPTAECQCGKCQTARGEVKPKSA